MGSATRWSHRISARVRAAIDQAEMPYGRVGELAGIPRATFERRIKDLNPFNTDELEQVALVLGYDPDTFLDPSRWPDERCAS